MKSVLALLIALSAFQPAFATTSEEVKQKTADAANSAANYTKEQKEAFQKDMDQKLTDMKKEIAEMKKSASEKTGAAKKEMDTQIANLEAKQKSMSKDLSKMKKSSGQAWDDMKDGMNKAWDSISASYEKAKSEYTEKK